MKINPLYLLIAISLAFVACDDDEKDPVTGGDTGGITGGDTGGTGGMGGMGGTGGMGGEMPPAEGDCMVSCAAFAECAVEVCTGYESEAVQALTDGCLETCTPALAGVFDSKETCQEKVDFVSMVQPPFAATCASTTGGFCEGLAATCGEWTNEEVSCADWYNAAPAGEAGATEGASQACYSYHLGAAMSEEEGAADTHCPHARGEMVCVDVVVDPAEQFCADYEATCGAWEGDTSCADWFNAAPAGEAGATEGASQACYSYHLGAAMSGEEGAADTHCPHARGTAVCVEL